MEGIQCLERRIYERPLTSEPFIENQSEHISKLSLHQSLVKRKFITKRYRRAREPSRISLRFLRRLKNKSSVLKKFLFKRISSILIPKSSKLHRYVKKVRKLYNTRYKCNHKHDPKIFYLIKVTVPKKTSLLSLSSRLYHVIMKLKCKARARYEIMPDTPGQEGAQGHAPNLTEIRVFSTGKSLRIEPFKIPENPLEVGQTWREWIEDFKDETLYFEITEIKDRMSALKIYGGKEIKKLACTLPGTAPVVRDDDYKKLKKKLDNHFLPKKNKHHGRFTFSKQRPIEGGRKNQRIASSGSKQTTESWNT